MNDINVLNRALQNTFVKHIGLLLIILYYWGNYSKIGKQDDLKQLHTHSLIQWLQNATLRSPSVPGRHHQVTYLLSESKLGYHFTKCTEKGLC